MREFLMVLALVGAIGIVVGQGIVYYRIWNEAKEKEKDESR